MCLLILVHFDETVSYRIYIGQFSYIIPPVSYIVCTCHGFLSAVRASAGVSL